MRTYEDWMLSIRHKRPWCFIRVGPVCECSWGDELCESSAASLPTSPNKMLPQSFFILTGTDFELSLQSSKWLPEQLWLELGSPVSAHWFPEPDNYCLGNSPAFQFRLSLWYAIWPLASPSPTLGLNVWPCKIRLDNLWSLF